MLLNLSPLNSFSYGKTKLGHQYNAADDCVAQGPGFDSSPP